MKAAVLHAFKTPLSIEEVPRPEPAADEVLIEVEVCGVCHSDLHVADGDWPQLSAIVKKPLILGHEIVGRVVERGSAVQDVQIGERVGVPWVHWTCGECDFCREGNENLVRAAAHHGRHGRRRICGIRQGSRKSYARIPDELSSEQAAPLLCAGVTVHRALKQAKIRAGQRLAVFGVGGLGHLAVQIGRGGRRGGDRNRCFRRKTGAGKVAGRVAYVLNAAKSDVVKELRRSGGVHVAMVTSAAKSAYDMAFYCVRPTGTLLVVGLPAKRYFISCDSDGRWRRFRSRLPPWARGKICARSWPWEPQGTIHCQVSARPLTEVSEVLGELSRGEISGRIVLRLGD